MRPHFRGPDRGVFECAGSRSSTRRCETASNRRALPCGRDGRPRSRLRSSGSASTSSRPASPPRHPATSMAWPRSRDAVTRVTVASLARTTAGDIDAAPGALAGAHRPRSTSSSRRARSTWSASSASRPTRCSSGSAWSVALRRRARGRGRVLAEDATRSDRDFLAEAAARPCAGAPIVDLPDTVGYTSPAEYAGLLRGHGRALPGARERRALRPLPQRPRARGRQLARGCRGRRDTGRVHGERHRRAAGNASLEEIAMALRVRPDRVCGRDRDRSGRDPRDLGARQHVEPLSRRAEQADRRRECIRARGRYPPGRDAEGRRDVSDHRPARPRRRP